MTESPMSSPESIADSRRENSLFRRETVVELKDIASSWKRTKGKLLSLLLMWIWSRYKKQQILVVVYFFVTLECNENQPEGNLSVNAWNIAMSPAPDRKPKG